MYKKITALSCSRNRLVYSKIFRAMKLIVVIILASMLQVSASSYAQISLKTKDVAIEEVFISIRQQSGYDFLYNADLLKKVKPVSIGVKNASITDVMDKLLENEPLTYVINDKTVTLKSKPYQEIQIRGKVTDQKGVGIQGVNVRIKGRPGEATSDQEGAFSIRVPDTKSILVFSFIGFVTQEVAVGTKTNFNITLLEQQQDLNQIVVTALGIKREERALGYAVTKIDSNQLTDAPSGNWLDALSGKVAGLNMVRSNGGPAGSNKIILRGENNLTGDNEALVVVDGVVISTGSGRRTATGGSAAAPSDGIQPTDFGSGINDINPEDIESVTVLKGPGASALYGQRGANGAIIITTKSGSFKRKFGVTVTSNGAMESANRWPDLQYEYGLGLNGAATYSYGANNTSLSWGPRFNGQSFIQYDPVTQAAATTPTPWVPYVNQAREFFETGKTFTNSVSLDGNIKKNTTYRVSASHGDNEWIIPNTGYKRTNLSFSANSKITPKLNLSVKANYTNRRSDNLPGMGYGNQSVMYWYVFWLPNADINWLRNYWVNGKEFRELKDIFTTSPENPYAISYEFINGSKRDGITANAQLNYSFTKELSLQLRATIDQTDDKREQKRPWTAARFATGSYRVQNIESREYTGDFLLKYNKKLNKDFNVIKSENRNCTKIKIHS
jgi:TonB-dependent SusC/RagA subfamily outer membrane receptor